VTSPWIVLKNVGYMSFNLRDVKLGGLILDHCNVESRRFDVLSSLYSGLLPVNEDDNVDVAKVRAWMTDITRSVIEVNEVAMV
jgi:hypothetical protein